MLEPRAMFGPVAGLGLVVAALAAVAGSRAWVIGAEADGPTPDPLGLVAEAGEMPLGLALALVLLACWGVLLVTRGAVRRLVAGLGLVASLGLVATVVVAWFTLDDQVLAAQMQASTPRDDVFGSTISGWYVVAAGCAVVSVVTTFLAVRWAPHWPEMGSRYDAPGSAGEARQDDPTSVDLWKSIDEGRDPTV